MRTLLKIAATSLFLLISTVLMGQGSLPEPMSPPRLVNDFAGIFTNEQRAELEQKLTAFDRETSTQVAIVTVNDLEGYAAGDFAQRILEKWGVGSKVNNNGIVFLVKPKTERSRGDVYISVGYGLEGVIPDITAGHILDNEVIPSFKQGDYFEGVEKGVDAIIALSKGEYKASEKDDENGSWRWIIIFWIIFLILIPLLRRGRKGGRGGGIWFPPIGGGSGTGGGFGGSGGFGGFGGGTGGGGGGGRSW